MFKKLRDQCDLSEGKVDGIEARKITRKPSVGTGQYVN